LEPPHSAFAAERSVPVTLRQTKDMLDRSTRLK
jgi:hypothetical protein